MAKKYKHLIPSFQMIEIKLANNEFSNLADHFNLFKIMASRQPNKRLFSQMNSSDEDDQELVKAEIAVSSKKKNKMQK